MQIRTRVVPRLAGIVAAVLLTACSTPDQQLQDIQKNVEGLTATTRAIGGAWVRGDVSATYSRTALRQTARLLDQQRSALAASSELLINPRGASISREAEQLSRIIAAISDDAEKRDIDAARQHVAQLPAAVR